MVRRLCSAMFAIVFLLVLPAIVVWGTSVLDGHIDSFSLDLTSTCEAKNIVIRSYVSPFCGQKEQGDCQSAVQVASSLRIAAQVSGRSPDWASSDTVRDIAFEACLTKQATFDDLFRNLMD